MARTSWIYPTDGSPPYEKGTYHASLPSGVMVMPDLPDFVSSVDGKLYSGRAGLREHNLRNNVVCNADLKGLPVLTTSSDQRTPEQRREYAQTRKQVIIDQVNRHWR